MVRELVSSDIPSLAQLYKLFWGEESDLDKMKTQFDLLQNNPCYILLGCFTDDNRLIGSVMGIVCPELYGQCQPFMVLENMVVETNRRRTGAGKSLLSELERLAVAAGCSQIILVTEKARRDACGFYEAMGFSKENAGYKKKLA